jgi:hypothetical protein
VLELHRQLRTPKKHLSKLRKSEEGLKDRKISSHVRRRRRKTIYKVKSLGILLARSDKVN